jgi:hypothetical protein
MRPITRAALLAALLVPVQIGAATVVDLTSLGSTGTVGGAIYDQGSTGSGTGNYDTFVRVQNNGTESGYNTDGTLEFDTSAGSHTHSLLFSSLAVVNVGGIDYYQFGLDINEPQSGANRFLSLDRLQIFSGTAGNLTGFGSGFGGPSFATLIYDLDAGGDHYVKLDASNSTGSGTSDMTFFLPTSLFTNSGQPYLYLFSQFGDNFESNGGFEEWGAVTGTNGAVPEPSTWAMLATGLTLVAVRKFRK